jgi:hypothetical protein
VPVAQVVAAPRLRFGGPVGHLVPVESRRRQGPVRLLVAVGQYVVVRCGEVAALDPAGQRGAVLDDQRVGRDVVDAGFQHGVEGCRQVGGPFAGGAVDQVQVDVVEACPAGFAGRFRRPAGGVGPVEDGQHVLGRGLHAQRDPRVARFADLLEERRARGLRVGLRRHLRVRGQAHGVADRVQHVRQARRAQKGRGAAADEDRVRLRGCAQHAGRQGQLRAQAVQPGLRRSRRTRQLRGGVGVEVAVATAGGAERDVHVDPERALPQAGQGRLGQRAVRGCCVTVREC